MPQKQPIILRILRDYSDAELDSARDKADEGHAGKEGADLVQQAQPAQQGDQNGEGQPPGLAQPAQQGDQNGQGQPQGQGQPPGQGQVEGQAGGGRRARAAKRRFQLRDFLPPSMRDDQQGKPPPC